MPDWLAIWWSIGLALLLLCFFIPGYQEALFAHPQVRNRSRRALLLSGWIAHMGIALLWPVMIISIIRYAIDDRRRRRAHLKQLKHWGHDE